MIFFDKAEVIVEWTTASELDTVGFNLLRAETQKGPFEQINSNLIPAGSDSLSGSNYNFTADLRHLTIFGKCAKCSKEHK